MRLFSPPPPPPASRKQQQQRCMLSLERLERFSNPSEVFRVRPTGAATTTTTTTASPQNKSDNFFGAPPSSGSTGAAFSKVLVLPGNPGGSSFYTHFAEELARELGTEVAALSFHGHETTSSAAKGKVSQPLCLDGQVEHASAFLEKLISEAEAEATSSDPPSVAVVGHSIGGTVAALAVKEVEEKRKKSHSSSSSSSIHVCAMMPYVAFDETSSQQRLLRVLASNRIARGAACSAARGLGRLLPRRALASLVAVATLGSPLAPRARETVADFVAADGLKHALYLASTEFDALAVGGGAGDEKKRKFRVGDASSIWEPLAALGSRASVFAAAEGDHWCPRHHLDRLKEQAPLARLVLDQEQRHDFVVCDERSSRAARDVARLLRESASLHAAATED